MSIGEAWRAARELSETDAFNNHLYQLGLALDSQDFEKLDEILKESEE